MSFLRQLHRNKFANFFIVLLLLLGVAAVAHSLWTHDYVARAYESSVAGKPISAFVDHTRHDLDHYHKRADLIFWQFIFFGIPLTILFWRLLWKMVVTLVGLSQSQQTPSIEKSQIRGDVWIALGAYTILTVVYFYPIIQSFGSAIIGLPGDNMAGMWNYWWGYDMSLLGSHSITFTNYIYFPEGSSMYFFAWSFYGLGLSYLFHQFMNHMAVFNLVILHLYPIAGLGAFLLVRRVTGNSLAAIVGGFLFAFSPAHVLRAQNHINMSMIHFIPFFVLFFMDCIRDRRRRSLILASLFFLLNALCDWTYMIMGGYFMLFGYLYLCLKQRRWWLPDYAFRMSVVALVTLVVLSPWLWQMMRIGITNPEVEVGGRNTFVADVLGFFVPGTEHWAGRWQVVREINEAYTGNAAEATSYLGIAALIVVIFAFRRTLQKTAKWWLGMAAFMVMSLGPQPHVLGGLLPIGLPYTLIAYVPFLSNVRAPGRFGMYVSLFWCVIVGLGLNELMRRYSGGWRRIVVVAIVPLLIGIDFLSICSAKTEVTAPAILMEIGSKDPASAILNLPLDYLITTRSMMEQTLHGLPMVNGAASRKIGKTLEDRLVYDDLAAQKQQLIEAGVKYIVIHTQLGHMESINVDAYRAHYELAGEDNECIVLRVY